MTLFRPQQTTLTSTAIKLKALIYCLAFPNHHLPFNNRSYSNTMSCNEHPPPLDNFVQELNNSLLRTGNTEQDFANIDSSFINTTSQSPSMAPGPGAKLHKEIRPDRRHLSTTTGSSVPLLVSSADYATGSDALVHHSYPTPGPSTAAMTSDGSDVRTHSYGYGGAGTAMARSASVQSVPIGDTLAANNPLPHGVSLGDSFFEVKGRSARSLDTDEGVSPQADIPSQAVWFHGPGSSAVAGPGTTL